MKFNCILADPPWQMKMAGKRRRAKEGVRPTELPYPTMTVEEISSLNISDLATDECHIWLWTTNSHLEQGFKVLDSWGFKYLAPIHWIKPSGTGNWFIHRTQTVLFGYKNKCRFELERYRPNILATGDPVRHSQKPNEFYTLIESISLPPRLELFARAERTGWSSWGNEVPSHIPVNSRV